MVTYIHDIYYIPWIQSYLEMIIGCGVGHKNTKHKCTVQLKVSYKKKRNTKWKICMVSESMNNLSNKLYLSFFHWLYSPIQALAASMKLSISLQLLDLGQSVGLLGRVISSSQGLCPYTNTQKGTRNTNTKHP
jgi:hypothetical protein